MAKGKGCRKYIPKKAWDEAVSIKQSLGLESNAEAFRKMADFSRLGREANVGYNSEISLHNIYKKIKKKK